jgi:hypothetical protein
MQTPLLEHVPNMDYNEIKKREEKQMRCKNRFCVYYSKTYCMLDEDFISMDERGQCAVCEYVEIDDYFLDRARDRTLQKIDR